MTEVPPIIPPPDASRADERRFSQETMVALAVARVAKALGTLDLHVMFATVATIASRVIHNSASTPEGRDKNRLQFNKGVDAALRAEAAVEQQMQQLGVDQEAAKKAAQMADPLRPLPYTNSNVVDMAKAKQERASEE